MALLLDLSSYNLSSLLAIFCFFQDPYLYYPTFFTPFLLLLFEQFSHSLVSLVFQPQIHHLIYQTIFFKMRTQSFPKAVGV